MQPYRGLELGRPLGSPLVAHRSWFPAGALLATHLAFSAYGDRNLAIALLLGVATVVGYFASVALHGLAHVLLGGRKLPVGVPVVLFVLGDVMRPPARASRRAVWTAAAGPLTSAAVGVACLTFSGTMKGTAADFLRTLAFTNFALTAVNLIPGLPLDGGRILAARGRVRLAVFAGRVFGVLFSALGIWLLLGGPSLLADTALGLWLVLVGLFVLLEAGPPDRETTLPRLDGQTVGAWARPFVGRLEPSSAVPHDGGPFAVSDDGRLAGVLATGATERGQRACEVMIPWDANLAMRSETPLVRGLERLAQGQTPLIVVVDAKGVVRGVLDEAAVRARLAET